MKGFLNNVKKTALFLSGGFPKGGGGDIPKLYVKFWWPLFLAMKFTSPGFEPGQRCDRTLALEGRVGCTQSELDSSTGSSRDCFVCHSLQDLFVT